MLNSSFIYRFAKSKASDMMAKEMVKRKSSAVYQKKSTEGSASKLAEKVQGE
jgi:hypothetical protein